MGWDLLQACFRLEQSSCRGVVSYWHCRSALVSPRLPMPWCGSFGSQPHGEVERVLGFHVGLPFILDFRLGKPTLEYSSGCNVPTCTREPWRSSLAIGRTVWGADCFDTRLPNASSWLPHLPLRQYSLPCRGTSAAPGGVPSWWQSLAWWAEVSWG